MDTDKKQTLNTFLVHLTEGDRASAYKEFSKLIRSKVDAIYQQEYAKAQSNYQKEK